MSSYRNIAHSPFGLDSMFRRVTLVVGMSGVSNGITSGVTLILLMQLRLRVSFC